MESQASQVEEAKAQSEGTKVREYLEAPPNWLISLKQSLSRNRQLQYHNYFSISLYDHDSSFTISDQMRYELIVESLKDLSATGDIFKDFENNLFLDGKSFLQKPMIITTFDSRSDIGRLLTNSQAKALEICWFMSLTRDKIRIKSVPQILSCINSFGRFDADTSKYLVDKVWSQLDDEEHLVFKRPLPGLSKLDIQDELLQYEPQVEDKIPSNFKLLVLEPFEIDHFMFAPPAVIADQRRKPQQYESLAQPFKKDRRFFHKFEAETSQWQTREVNP